MSSQYRRRVGTTGPTAIRVLSDESVTLAEAEALITSYIDYTESSSFLDAAAEAAISAEQSNPESTIVDSIASAIARNENVVGQLKRVQRNMRGLPPVRTEEPQAQTQTQQQYDEQDVEMGESIWEEAQTGTKRKISAEERKRLKKERRKSEKRTKSLAAAAEADPSDNSEKDNDDSE